MDEMDPEVITKRYQQDHKSVIKPIAKISIPPPLPKDVVKKPPSGPPRLVFSLQDLLMMNNLICTKNT